MPPIELPDQASDAPAFDGVEPPFRVRFHQGPETIAEAVFEKAIAGFGNGRIELHYADGRHVTISPSELVEVR